MRVYGRAGRCAWVNAVQTRRKCLAVRTYMYVCLQAARALKCAFEGRASARFPTVRCNVCTSTLNLNPKPSRSLQPRLEHLFSFSRAGAAFCSRSRSGKHEDVRAAADARESVHTGNARAQTRNSASERQLTSSTRLRFFSSSSLLRRSSRSTYAATG